MDYYKIAKNLDKLIAMILWAWILSTPFVGGWILYQWWME